MMRPSRNVQTAPAPAGAPGVLDAVPSMSPARIGSPLLGDVLAGLLADVISGRPARAVPLDVCGSLSLLAPVLDASPDASPDPHGGTFGQRAREGASA